MKTVATESDTKSMTGHNLEYAIACEGACMEGAFWNPLDVSDLAWGELLRKLSAVAAIEEVQGPESLSQTSDEGSTKKRKLTEDDTHDDDGSDISEIF